MEQVEGIEAMLDARGIDPRQAKLYRHAGKDAEKAWLMGEDAFARFVEYQGPRLFSGRLRFLVHCLAAGKDASGHHLSRYLGVTELVGAVRKVRPDDLELAWWGMTPADVGEAEFCPQRWVTSPSKDNWSEHLVIRMGAPRRPVWANHPYAISLSVNDNEAVPEMGYPFAETRIFREHITIERRALPSDLVKARRGLECEGCGLDAPARFGALASRVIEAHHLTPLAQLKDGEVRLTGIEDFRVLCANCHRLIHGLDRPDDMEGLRALVRAVGTSAKD